MTNEVPQIPAGWLADPTDPTRVRYWDGAAWTSHTQTLPQAPPAPSAPTWGHPQAGNQWAPSQQPQQYPQQYPGYQAYTPAPPARSRPASTLIVSGAVSFLVGALLLFARLTVPGGLSTSTGMILAVVDVLLMGRGAFWVYQGVTRR